VQGNRNGFNNPDVYRLEIPAANGICTARGLAQAFNGVAMGKVWSAGHSMISCRR
jgi:hypothetical protein